MKISIQSDDRIMDNGEVEVTAVTIEQPAEVLPDVLQLVKQALLGLGYVFNGEVVIEENEVDENTTED
jgi:hypothetical protein